MGMQHLPADSAVAVCSRGKELYLPLLSDCLWLGTSVKIFKWESSPSLIKKKKKEAERSCWTCRQKLKVLSISFIPPSPGFTVIFKIF